MVQKSLISEENGDVKEIKDKPDIFITKSLIKRVKKIEDSDEERVEENEYSNSIENNENQPRRSSRIEANEAKKRELLNDTPISKIIPGNNSESDEYILESDPEDYQMKL